MINVCKISLATLWAGLLLSSTALAGEADKLVKIAPRPPGSQVMALASINGGHGLIYSRDGGQTFTVQCGQAVSTVMETEDGPKTTFLSSFETSIVTHDGRVLVGDVYGLWIDDGHGCGWQRLPEERYLIKALTHDPVDPRIIYGATGSGSAPNGVFRRNADGTIEDVGDKHDLPIYSLQVVALPDGGRRFYKLVVTEHVPVDIEAGERVLLEEGELPPMGTRLLPFYVIQYSDDHGESWTSHDLGPDLGGGSYRIAAVDPTNPDRLVLAVERFKSGGAPDLLLVSEDRGETRRPWHQVMTVSAVTFAPDGQVWIGDSGEGTVDRTRGLWHAASLMDEPRLVTDAYPVWCAELRDGALEACSHDRYGVADLETGELQIAMQFKELAAVHSCEGTDIASTCQRSFCSGRCKHWHEAPFCIDEYNATLYQCGGVAIPGAGGGGAVSSGGAGGGLASSGGAGGGAMSSGGAGGTSGASGASGAAMEPMGDEPAMQSDGGCACRAAGGRRDGPSAFGWIAAACFGLAASVRRLRRGT